MPRHELTPEDRANGGHARAAAIAKRKADANERALAKLDTALDKAIDRYVEGLDAEALIYSRDGENSWTETDHRTRIQAADRITDRLLGKPTQHTELTGADGGPVVLENDVSSDQAEAVIAGLVDAGLLVLPARNGDAADDEVHPAPAD